MSLKSVFRPLKAQLPPLLESTPKPLLIPAYVRYPKETAYKLYDATRPQFREIFPLWGAKQNEVIVNKFMYNKLVREMAFYPNKAENLAAFKNYMLQDYLFLIELYLFREARLKSIYKPDSGSYASEVAGLDKLQKYIDQEFVQNLKTLSIDHLKGQVKPCKALQDYIGLLKKHGDVDSFYELNLISVPCSFGWSVLAQDLYNHPQTVKEGYFYEMFIKPNVTDYVEYELEEVGTDGIITTKVVKEPRIGGYSATARRVGEFMDFRIPPKDYTKDKAVKLIGDGLLLETALFDAGFNPDTNKL